MRETASASTTDASGAGVRGGAAGAGAGAGAGARGAGAGAGVRGAGALVGAEPLRIALSRPSITDSLEAGRYFRKS